MPIQLSTRLLHKLDESLSNVGDMSLKRRAKNIIQGLDPKKGEKIIDLGCGTGYYLFLLSNLGIKLNLTGLDYDERAVKEARENLKQKGVSFMTGDLHKIPFRDKTFDKAVMSEVLEHVKDDEKVLKEVRRILKPNGVLVISVPSINYPFLWDPINWILQHFLNIHIKNGFFSGLWSGHLRLYEKETLRNKFEKAGFKVQICEELTYWCLPFNHYIINAVARLLYDVKISSRIADTISKFKNSKKPLLINIAFKFVNWVDKLNKIFPQKTGVNIFIKASRNN